MQNIFRTNRKLSAIFVRYRQLLACIFADAILECDPFTIFGFQKIVDCLVCGLLEPQGC